MKPSLYIWLHPRRTARQLADLQESLEQTSLQASRSAELAGKLQEELEQERTENTSLHSRLAQACKQGSRLTASLISARATLQAQDKEIKEIQALFAQVETMKANYERRINSLKTRLAQARHLPGASAEVNTQRENADDLADDLTLSPLRPSAIQPELPLSQPDQEDDLDWYTTPPEL